VLQFEVLTYRLRAEYGVDVQLDRLPYRHARWVEGEGVDPEEIEYQLSTSCLVDASGRSLILFADDWALSRAAQSFPNLTLVAAVQPARAVKGAA
jgi:peptide chain release factor 3